MSAFGKRLILAFLLTLVADRLIFCASPGLGLTAFAVLTGATLAVLNRGRLRRAGVWLAIWCVLAANTAWTASTIGAWMLIVMTWVVLALMLAPEPPQFLNGVVRGLTGGARSYTLLGSDLRRWVLITLRIAQTRTADRRKPWLGLPPFWVYALPVGLIALFAILIVPANLVLAKWVGDGFTWAWNQAANVLEGLDPDRTGFWVVVGLGLYGLIRFRLGRHPAHHLTREALRNRFGNLTSGPLPKPELAAIDGSHELKACLMTFIGLNILYLAANATDLFYIWLHFTLPAGMTYAQFAHHGSYRLIVAVVLAAILVPAFFRIGTGAATNARARLLAYAFIAQNLMVLLGAARRLMIYDEVYGLSRFRVATYLWLALVAVGFVLTWIKVARQKRFRFLVQTNAIATALLLTAVGWMNLDGFIANWNVDRYLSGQTKIIDVEYLGDLDASALPALGRLIGATDPAVRNEAQTVYNRRFDQETALLKDWRCMTWERARGMESHPGSNPG
ncbi:MAG: DUF4173 domain-containing protein [Planctomycetota bacterium]